MAARMASCSWASRYRLLHLRCSELQPSLRLNAGMLLHGHPACSLAGFSNQRCFSTRKWLAKGEGNALSGGNLLHKWWSRCNTRIRTPYRAPFTTLSGVAGVVEKPEEERRMQVPLGAASSRAAAEEAVKLPGALLAFYCDTYVVPLPPNHRFPMTKYAATRQLLQSDESLRGLVAYAEAPMVAAMHAVMFDLPGRRKAAAHIAGGTHHAFSGHGEGFCVFNDIAVAAAAALVDYPDRCNEQAPILVVDLDVHQGNGTAKLFEGSRSVITFSVHGANNYPWKTKMTSHYDVELPDGTDDVAYLRVLQEWLPHLFDTHKPSLVFFQAGVDALKEDSFGRLGMTRAGLLKRNNMVYSQCLSRGLSLVITMGGGYSRPYDASVQAHADVYRSAALRYNAPDPASSR